MPDIVRFVHDGEELVLWEGDAFRVQAAAAGAVAAERKVRAVVPTRIAIQYLGFEHAREQREYRFDARSGEESRRYRVSIELAAFSKRQALFQDGPDICYQMLTRHVADSGFQGSDRLQVTEEYLAAYRETHAPPKRNSFAPSPRTDARPADEKASPSKGGGIA
jgi:hypothetical protein